MPITKKTSAKPTAKKTTATKPAAKKTAATKSVVKKTSKASVKPKTASSTKSVSRPAAKPALELSVSGNKKIGTLQKEFNKKFPYLRLGLYYSYMRKEATKTQLPEDKTIASVRRADSGGNISISGNRKIKSLEKEFDTVFGVYAQVCYTDADGHRYYTSGSTDDKTLSAFNAECEKNGCKKGMYR